ncbi:hypothetical protein LCGC14_1957470, partial [marine sediment metagenome]
ALRQFSERQEDDNFALQLLGEYERAVLAVVQTLAALDDVKAAVAAHRAGGEETAKLLAALQIAADAAARIVDDAKGDKYRTVRLVATGAKILVRRIRDSVG